MNSWKLNNLAGHAFRLAICNSLGLPFSLIYITVKSVEKDIITTKNGKKYKLVLEEIKT